MRVLIATVGLGLMIVAAASSSLRAQTANPATSSAPPANPAAVEPAESASDLSLEDLAKVTIYTASKHLQNASDAPASVTVVTADEIQKYGYRTLADILQSVRGFYITYDRDYSFVGVRGFGRLGDWNTRILLLIDGHRVNNNILGQAMLGTEFLVDVDLIERVEIIRGPSSSLYGADAFFAVINVITRKPSQTQGLELSFSPASFGTYQGRATYAGHYKQFDWLLSGTFSDSHGPTLFFPEFNSPATNNGITSNTDYENSQDILATIDYHGFTLQGLYKRHNKGVPTGYFGTIFNDPRTLNLDTHQYLDLSYQHSIGHKWDLSARTSYDQVRLQAPVDFPVGNGSADLNTYSFRGNWWDGEIKLSRVLFDKHKLTIGSEVTDNLRQDQGEYDSAINLFTADPASSRVWAVYAQDEFAIASKLVLSAGLRYDHYSNFGGTTNPRLGLIYHVLPTTTLKLLYGTAFRAPEPYEVTPDFGAFYEDDLQLRPETIRSVEGVVEQDLGKHFKLSGSVFRNWIGDLISLETDPSNNLSVYLNSGSAQATGVEAEFNVRLPGGLQSTASYSYTRAVGGNTGLTLDNSPQHLAKLNVSLPMLQSRLVGSVDAQYTSSRLTLAGNTVAAYPVFNVTLLGHALGKHLDVSASAYNLLNKKYFDPGRPEDVEDTIQQDGINGRLKLTFRF